MDNIIFRLNTRIRIDWQNNKAIVFSPKITFLSTELSGSPPMPDLIEPFEQKEYKIDSPTFALLRMFSRPRLYKEIYEFEKDFSVSQIEKAFYELEKKRIIVPGFSLNKNKNEIFMPENNAFSEKIKGKAKPLSPVLLIGGGTGQATIGLVYLSSYLRRNGVEAWIWDSRASSGYLDNKKQIQNIFKKRKYALVGISYKWYHHVSQSLLIGATINQLYPDIPIIYGGNSATLYWKELIRFSFVDGIILGDGEKPLLDLCKCEENPPNCIISGNLKKRQIKSKQSYSQRGIKEENSKLHNYDNLFINKGGMLRSFPLIVGGKGCDANCLYCGGSQPNQERIFKRKHSFVRPPEDVRNDIIEMLPYHNSLFLDFTTNNTDMEQYLREVFKDIDLSNHTLKFFPWTIPSESLLKYLTTRFYYVSIELDIGCLSENQRAILHKRGYYKFAPKNKDILDFADSCDGYDNIIFSVCCIFGLPYVKYKDFRDEKEFVLQLKKKKSFMPSAGLLLQAQPGALVTEKPELFEMVVSTKTFWDYLSYFEEAGDNMGEVRLRVCFINKKLDRLVIKNAEEIQKILRQPSDEMTKRYTIKEEPFEEIEKIRLIQEKHLKFKMSESEWICDTKSVKEKFDFLVYIFKNMWGRCVYFNKYTVPFDTDGNNSKANKIAHDIITTFRNPMSIGEAFYTINNIYPIKKNDYLEFLRLATREQFLKIISL